MLVWFLKIAVTVPEDEATFGIFGIETINNLVISHIFAHLNLLFIRLSVEWSVRDDSDYDVEDDNAAEQRDRHSAPVNVTLCCCCCCYLFSNFHRFARFLA